MTTTRERALDACLVALVAVVPSIAQMGLPLQANDEGLLLLHPDAMTRGLLPYRDFATPYGPLGFWVLQAASAPFGSSLITERLIGTLYHLVIPLALWLLLRPSLGRAPALSAGLAAGLVLLTVPPVALAWFGGVAVALCGFVVAARPGSRPLIRLAVGGALVGLAAGYRPELGVLALALLPAARGLRAVLPLFAGFVMGLVPLLAVVAQAPARFLDLPLARVGVDARMALSTVGAPIWAIAAVSLGGAALGLVRWRRLGVAPRMLVVASWVLLPGFAQRPDWVHATFWGCVGVPLFVALVAAELSPWPVRHPEGARMLRLAGSAVVVGTVIASVIIGLIARGVPLTRADRTVLVPRAEQPELESLLAAVDRAGRPGDALMVGPQRFEQPALPPIWLEYLFPDWQTTQYFREWIPGITEHRADILVADLKRADVLVLADLTQQARTLFPGVSDGPDTANQYVADHFCVSTHLPSYEVLVRSRPREGEVAPPDCATT